MRNKLENAISQKNMTMVTPVKSDKHVYAALKMRNKLENAISQKRLAPPMVSAPDEIKSDAHLFAAYQLKQSLHNEIKKVTRTQSKLRKKNTTDILVESIEDEHTQYLKIKQQNIEMEKNQTT